MKKELIEQLFKQFENACYIYEGVECWSARELQEILGYSKWDNFLNVLEKAKKACETAGAALTDHFADVGKMIRLGSVAERKIEYVILKRKNFLKKSRNLKQKQNQKRRINYV